MSESPTKSRWRLPHRFIALSAAFGVYVLSTGPIAHATNNGYLPHQVEWIYLPLVPFLYSKRVNQLFFYYRVHIWGGFPYGYTTLDAPFSD